MRENPPVSVCDRGKVEMKNKIAFLPQNENCLVFASCHGCTMNWLQWVTAFHKSKKANLPKITGGENCEYYRLMALPYCFAGMFVNDSYALTACCPPASQEEVVATTLQL